MIVWALFDSGNGSYTKGIKELNEKRLCNIEVYPIGIDIEKRNNHFINLNLADYSRLFGDNTLFGTLDKLPKPDLIIASPPCESWSNASAMTGGNACWKQEDLSDSLFIPQKEASMFTIRNAQDYEEAYINYKKEKFEIYGKKINVHPDVISDFRDMPFENNTFNLVVFDPPHLKRVGPNSIMKAQYGQLDKDTWSEDLAKGFEECMRVLKTGGTLIFKWSDCQVNVKEILKVIPFNPLFGQQRGTTHWMTFVKFEEVE